MICIRKHYMRNVVNIVFILFFFGTIQGQTFDLDSFLRKAYKHSPLIQKQANNNKIIDLNIEQLKRIYSSPTINLNANVLFAPIISNDVGDQGFKFVSQGASDYIGYDLGISNGGQYQALISIDQPLFTKNHIDAQKSKASVLKEKYANRVTLTKIELQQTVTHQYILCIQSKKMEENAEMITQIIKNQLNEMRPLVNSGIIKYIDLKLIEMELQNNLIEQERLKNEYISNLNTLYLLCGIESNTIIKLKDIDLQISNKTDKTSVFTEQYQLDSLSITTDQKINKLKYLPQVNVFGNAGLNTTYLPTLDRFGFSVGLAFNWNLFDGNQQKIYAEKSQIQLNNISIEKDYFINQNQIRKKNIIVQIASLEKQFDLINDQLVEYDNLLKLYKTEVKESLVSILELKTLIKEIALKQHSRTNTLLSKQILINAYNYWNH